MRSEFACASAKGKSFLSFRLVPLLHRVAPSNSWLSRLNASFETMMVSIACYSDGLRMLSH